MKPRDILFLGLRFVALVLICLVLYFTTAGIGVSPDIGARLSPEQVQRVLSMVPIAAVLNMAVVAYLIVRSRWHGWKLTLAIAFSFYGIYTFLQQIEALAFPAVATAMPPGFIISRFWVGALVAAILAPLAVVIMGKWSPRSETAEPNLRLVMPVGEWIWKSAAILLAYEVIYFGFGYYVAWRTPGLPEFYGGADPGTFFGQFANVMRDTPWLPLLAAFRGICWTLFVLPVIRMLKGSAWETGLAIGLALSVLVASQLLVPNPFWPEYVGRAHMIELASSNFVFGMLLAVLLLWRPKHLPMPSAPSMTARPSAR
jgi:hypothetical protein